MKGNDTIIQHLNDRLAEELTGINQYFVHAEMAENWDYDKLADVTKKRSIVEMRHAEALIERILYLEGKPIVSKLNEIRIGADVPQMHRNDLDLELGADKHYNESIKVAAELGDDGTKKLLENILKDEEEHIDNLEAQLDQIEQMGLQNYLAQQV
jgi:bacterioferritin